MKRLLTILPQILIFCLISCGGTKTVSTTVTNKKEVEDVKVNITETANIVTEHFGDTLKGVLPLPKLSKEPLRYKVSSGGAVLDLELTDSSLTYTAIPKHTGTTTANIVKTTNKDAVKTTNTVIEDQTKVVKHKWRPLIWLNLLVIAALIVAIKYFKNPFKLF